MKTKQIIGVLIIIIAIGVIINTFFDSSTYANFKEADANNNNEFHVVGKLNKKKNIIYNPVKNPNEFIFWMIDNEGKEKKIVLHKAKPQDFEHSEQIVVIGKSKKEEFHAKDILMKCPSKYNENK